MADLSPRGPGRGIVILTGPGSQPFTHHHLLVYPLLSPLDVLRRPPPQFPLKRLLPPGQPSAVPPWLPRRGRAPYRTDVSPLRR